MATNAPSAVIQQILKIPFWTASISFLFGTIIMLLYLINEDDKLVVLGFLYVAVASVINLAILLAMVALSFIHREHQKAILENTATILINIPIAIIYFFIIIKQIN